MQAVQMKIALASESQFRKRAMDLIGVAYETCPTDIDEKAIERATGSLQRWRWFRFSRPIRARIRTAIIHPAS